ncbi:methyltransferase [Pseudomonas sp. X10]
MKVARDRIFDAGPLATGSFKFDDSVSAVFDDMVGRSVPCYSHLQRCIADLFAVFSLSKVALDIGCSTGSTLKAIAESRSEVKALHGIDISDSMVERAQIKLAPYRDKVTLSNKDLAIGPIEGLGEVDFVILTLVLQFVRPIDREKLLANMVASCPSVRAVILVEKIVFPHPYINQRFIDAYYAMKSRNGYSDDEIYRKRLALENLLIPYTHEENIELMRTAGFFKNEIFFSYLNFRGYIFYRD